MTAGLSQLDRLGRLTLRGARLRADVAEAVTAATVDLGVEQVTELTLRVEDPDLRLLSSGLFAPGTFVDYADLRLIISALEVNGGSAGTGGLAVDCRPVLVDKLKLRRGPLVLRSVSPSTFVEREAKAAGARQVIAEPSATRAQVARDIARPGDTDTAGASSWTTCQRLARELGYLFYEAAGVVYFGRPSWLLGRLSPLTVTWGVAARRDPANASRTVPVCRLSRDDRRDRATVSVELDPDRADDARPGKVLRLLGVPGFTGRYLIDRVSFDLAGTGSVSVEASTPENPKPEPAEDRDKDRIPDGDDYEVEDPDKSSARATGGSAAAAGGKATRSARDFVRVAQTQAGDVYRFGAEASASDADPDAFDCSELVEWALARVGVRFVDGSVNQINRCRAITVEQGIRTRGALLFRPGTPNHIAISLGDGRTIEARGRAYGVASFPATGRFTRAGLVPGLDY